MFPQACVIRSSFTRANPLTLQVVGVAGTVKNGIRELRKKIGLHKGTVLHSAPGRVQPLPACVVADVGLDVFLWNILA